jgi:hypothetical protein
VIMEKKTDLEILTVLHIFSPMVMKNSFFGMLSVCVSMDVHIISS